MSVPRELHVQEVVFGLDFKGRMLKGRGGYFSHQEFCRGKKKSSATLSRTVWEVLVAGYRVRGAVGSER